MSTEKKDDTICVSHILLPKSDPQKRYTDQQIDDARKRLQSDLNKDPKKFGIAAVQLSSDYATTIHNPDLNTCVQGLSKIEDPKAKSQKAASCMEKFGGEIKVEGNCPSKSILDPKFVSVADKLKPGQIGYVDTQFGHHIVRRNSKGL